MDDKLKQEILQAFAEGLDPVGAVIRFKVVPDVIKALYEEYARSQGGMVVWGDTVRELEQLMGLPPGAFHSADAMLAAITALSQKVERERKAVLDLLEPYGWFPVEEEPMLVKHKDTGQTVDIVSVCACHGKAYCVECGRGMQ